jgi:NADP-dependent 3-hydroxy acid dehydrogenase YdfG
MPGTVAGRVALVTGASSGIGEGTALALAAAGAVVAVSARRADRLQALVQRLQAAGGEAISLPGDLTDETVARGVVAQTLRRLGRLDILVNSAGIIQPGRVENADAAQWRRALEVNLLATLHTCSAAVGPMRAQGGGDIINISATAARRAVSPYGPHAASKFGLAALTENLRQEVGAQGIRVCVLEPGATSTEASEGITDPGYRQLVHEHVNKEGAMQPEDVAAAVLFILSLPARANVSGMLIRPTTEI